MTTPLHPVPGQPDHGLDPLPVNVFVTTSSTVVVAPVPGVMAEHVHVVVAQDRLTITAQRDEEAEREYVLHEWSPVGFERTIDLPVEVGWPITATVAHGQLTVTLSRRGTRPDDETITIVPPAEHQIRTEAVSDVIDLRHTDHRD